MAETIGLAAEEAEITREEEIRGIIGIIGIIGILEIGIIENLGKKGDFTGKIKIEKGILQTTVEIGMTDKNDQIMKGLLTHVIIVKEDKMMVKENNIGEEKEDKRIKRDTQANIKPTVMTEMREEYIKKKVYNYICR